MFASDLGSSIAGVDFLIKMEGVATGVLLTAVVLLIQSVMTCSIAQIKSKQKPFNFLLARSISASARQVPQLL